MAGVTINQGTQTSIYTKTNGGTEIQVIKLDIGAGTTVADFGGTILAVNNVAKGTVTRLEGGTLGNLAAGTLTEGTVSTIGLTHPNAWGTVVSTGTNTLGTIKAAVSGSIIYVTDITISVGSASNIVIASGGTSTPLLGTLFLNANGGLVGNYRTPLQTASGSALVYQQSAAVSPLTIQANGYVK